MFDDENATLFLRDNFRPEVSARFENLTDGAHKADLFRYAFLYVNGGVWLDADVEMREPMESIFDRSNTIYTAKSGVFDDVFQAILASPPRIEFLNDLVEEIVASDLNGHGLPFTVWFKDRLLKSTGIDSLKVGRVLKSVNGPDFYLFEESCSKERSEICPALDKYGLCCWVMDVEPDHRNVTQAVPKPFTCFPPVALRLLLRHRIFRCGR